MKGPHMKRLGVFLILTFLLWYAAPAGAHSIPSIAITCDAVSITWESFPEQPVDLNVTVTQGDETTTASVSTEGKASGEASVPVDLASGPASASVSWMIGTEHHAGPVTADLDCATTTTTASTSTTTSTVPPPTTSPPTTAVVPPPEECGTATLPCTGSDDGFLWVVGAVLIAVGGTLFLIGRTGRRAR